jgi:hypothetical protein
MPGKKNSVVVGKDKNKISIDKVCTLWYIKGER